VGITLTPKGSGDVTVTSGRVLAGTSGDVAAYAFTGMNTTGLGLYGTNNLALYQGGSRILNYWGGVMELQIPMQGASESVYLNPGVTGINSPSYTFRDYTGYGMGLDAAGSKLSLVAGGSSRMVATSTGNIGIGTTAPLETLDIRASDENGILVVRNTTSTAARTDHIRVENFTNGNGGAAGLNLQSYRGTNAAPAALNSGDVVGQIFFNGGKDASWGVGYGASIQATAAGNFTGTSAPTDLTFATTPTGNTAPTERIRITASGNVGVGTSSVNEKLTVEGVTSLRAVAAPTLTANYGKIYVDSGDSNKLKYMNPAGAVTDLTAGAGTAFVQNGNSFSGTATIGTNDAQSLVLETNNTAAVTIQSNGNIGLGYGSPSYAVHTQKTHSHTSGWVPMAFDYVWFSPGSAPAAGTHSIANYSAVETGGASSLSNATITGTVSHAKHSSTQQVNNSTGAYSWVENNSAGTINAAMGSNSEVVNDSAGTINSAIGSQGVITNSSGTMTSGMAVYGMVNNSASMTRGYGASFDVTNSSATNMTDLLGINAAVVNTASATVTTAIGYNTSLRNEGTGSMTTAIGLNATVANTGAGSIGTGYGVLIGNIAGTTKYGLYQSDATARNVMSGNLSVGTSNSHGVATIEGVTALRAVAAPTATANYGKVYVDSADSNKLKYMNPAGTVTDLTAGAGSAFVNGGNSFGANAVIGTNDSYNMSFEVNGTTRARITPSSGFTFLGSWAGGYTPSKTSGWDTNLDGITVENTTNSDNNGSQVELLVRNTAGTDQRAYIGAVSENTGYAPSIIFGQRSGNTAYDERMRITPSGNVGIGTSNPYQTFEVVRTNSDTGILVGNYGGATPRYPAMIAQNYIDTSGSGWPEFFGISSRGTAGTPAATQSGDVLAVFGGKGTYNTSYGSRMSAYMYIAASENHGASNGGGHMRFYTTNNGTTSATEKMRITDNGNVGVGTTAPAAQLHVSRADTDTSLIVENSSSTAARYPTIEIRNYRGASSGAPEFKTYIANGTASAPTAVTAWSVTGGMTFGGYDGTDAGASAAIYSWASENWTNSANGGEMSLYTTPNGTTGAVERIKISQNGNVGVGYNSPTSRLDVVGSAANGTLKISSSGTDASAKDAAITVRHYTNAEEPMSLIYANAAAAANSIYIGGGHASQNAATDISFLTAANSTTTSGTERMRIDSSGNVGIGTTAPSDKLHIAGGSLRIDNDTNTTNKGCIRFDGTAMQYSNDCTTYVNFASSTGGGWTDAGATMYTTTSTDNVGIGHASPLYKLHVVNTATTIPRGIVQDQISNDNSAALFGGRHARGTPGAPTAVANADFIASLGASPYDGFAGFQVNGTVAAGSVPTDFIVHNGAAAGSLTEKLRLTSAGNLQVGNSAHEVFTNPPAISISKNVAPYISIGHWSNDLMMIGKDSTDFFTMASENTMGGIKFKVNGAFAATQFIDTATTAMTIDNLGEVGIGTTTPTSPLHVVATSTDTSGAPKANYYYYTANPGAASTATYYGSNGSVGKGSNANLAGATFVGVAGVAEQGGTGTLNNATGVEGFVTKYGTGNINNVNGIYSHVQSTTTGTISNYNGLLVNTNISSGTLTQAAGVRIEDLQATTGYGIYQEGTNDSNYFAGNVGIGATSPGAKLEVSGNATGLVRLNGPATTGYSGIEFHENSAVRWMMYQDSSTDRLQVGDGDNSHGVYMSQNVSGWTNYSDARLKEEVKDYSVLDKLEKFRAVTFKWKLTGTAGIGVIAQEVAQAFPEVVEQGDQDLNRGISSINDPGVWGVHYDHLAPIALQGVKEVHGLCKMTQEQMNALEARVSQTERDIASLKEENAQLKGQTAKLKTENADIKARLERLEKALSQGK
jgi:hypothetical protein